MLYVSEIYEIVLTRTHFCTGYRKRSDTQRRPEQYFRDGKQRFDLDSTTITTSSRLQRLLVGILTACVVLIIV